MAIVKAERGQFIVLDSEVKAVLTILSWGELKSRWVYHLKDEYDRDHREPVFDLHPVIPQKRVQTKARFSLTPGTVSAPAGTPLARASVGPVPRRSHGDRKATHLSQRACDLSRGVFPAARQDDP